MFCSGRYYKHITIVNDGSNILSDWHHNLDYHSRSIMEQHILKTVNNCLNTNIYSYLETSGHFFNTSLD